MIQRCFLFILELCRQNGL